MPLFFRRRIVALGAVFDYSAWLTQHFPNADRWDHQDLSGSSVLSASYTTALTAPDTRSVALLTYGDYVAGANWANSSGQIARHTAGSVETFQQDDILAAGKTYQVTITLANRTAGSVTITDGGAAISANEQTTRTIISTGTDFIITPTTDFDGDIDVAIILVQQTGILASSAYPGDELLDESGASGTATAANWTANNNADLTNPSVGILRVARDGINTPRAFQNVYTTGRRYLLTGEARSDGNATPRVINSGPGFTGTTSTGWQSFRIEFVKTASASLLESVTSTGTEYTEWRNLSTKPANPMNGDHTAVIVGVPANFGSLGLATRRDGSTSLTNASSAELNSKWDKENIFIGRWFNPDTLGANKVLFRVGFDADNWVDMYTNDGSHVTARYRVGGVDKEVELAASTGEWGFYAVRYTGGSFNGLKNGVAGTPIVAAVIDLNIDEFIIGAATSAPTLVVDGDDTRTMVAYENITDAQVLSIYNRGRR